MHLIVTSKKENSTFDVWLPEIPGIAQNQLSPYTFEPKDLKTQVYTGLQVSHEPGQWAVWAGVILMAIGLTFVFYLAHVRFWVVPLRDAESKLSLWVGGTANRNRDAFEFKFKQLLEQIGKELKTEVVTAAEVESNIR